MLRLNREDPRPNEPPSESVHGPLIAPGGLSESVLRPPERAGLSGWITISYNTNVSTTLYVMVYDVWPRQPWLRVTGPRPDSEDRRWQPGLQELGTRI